LNGSFVAFIINGGHLASLIMIDREILFDNVFSGRIQGETSVDCLLNYLKREKLGIFTARKSSRSFSFCPKNSSKLSKLMTEVRPQKRQDFYYSVIGCKSWILR